MSARIAKPPRRDGGQKANSSERSTRTARHDPELAAQRRCTCSTCTETTGEIERLQTRHRDVDDLTAKLWSTESAQQLESLRQKYPADHALRIMEDARIIAGESMLDREHPMRAAVKALERIEQLRNERSARARWIANARRRRKADKQVIEAFRTWEMDCAAVLKDLSATERVAQYVISKGLSRRARDRIRTLQKAGKL